MNVRYFSQRLLERWALSHNHIVCVLLYFSQRTCELAWRIVNANFKSLTSTADPTIFPDQRSALRPSVNVNWNDFYHLEKKASAARAFHGWTMSIVRWVERRIREAGIECPSTIEYPLARTGCWPQTPAAEHNLQERKRTEYWIIRERNDTWNEGDNSTPARRGKCHTVVLRCASNASQVRCFAEVPY